MSANEGLNDIGGNAAMTTPTFPSVDQTSWKSKIDKSISKSRSVRGGNYVQLATVDLKLNEPRCRSVVFRGFITHEKDESTLKDNDVDCSKVFKMITDQRSQKVNESEIAEIVWWFFNSKEQYRIRGKLKYVGNSDANAYLAELRKQQWERLTDSAREQFFWNEPGVVFDQHQVKAIPKGGKNEETGELLEPSENFLLMLLYPFRVDYLRLKDNYRQIDNFSSDGEWSFDHVNP